MSKHTPTHIQIVFVLGIVSKVVKSCESVVSKGVLSNCDVDGVQSDDEMRCDEMITLSR